MHLSFSTTAENRAYLVGVQTSADTSEDTAELLEEIAELAGNLDWDVCGSVIFKLREPHARYWLGEGKTQQILENAQLANATVIIIDGHLSPAQQRNWEQLAKMPVLDRQEVILNIFERRAQTHEARLQVQLARLEHTLPRLKRAWTHLSRQRGGGALQRGEGETQLELDQRMIHAKISQLKGELLEVIQRRSVQRKQRLKIPLPAAALVGYTNAGKSSLLNALTGADVLSADKLFATLDPTTRRCQLPGKQTLLLTDTVGFIRRLPHQLVDAFKATLEETLVSNLLIHVLDAAHPDVEKHSAATLSVLEELGAHTKRMITVFNKCDLIASNTMRKVHLKALQSQALFVSAKTGEGLELLKQRIDAVLKEDIPTRRYHIDHKHYGLLHELHQAGGILEQTVEDDGVHVLAQVPERLTSKFEPFLENGR